MVNVGQKLDGVEITSGVYDAFSCVFEQACRNALIGKNSSFQVSRLESWTLEQSTRVAGTCKWCTWIMILGDLFQAEIHFFYNSGFVPKLLESHAQFDRIAGDDRRVTDFVKELTNLAAGESLGILERAKIPAVIGIPVTSRGIDFLGSEHAAFPLSRFYVAHVPKDPAILTVAEVNTQWMSADACGIVVRSRLAADLEHYSEKLVSSLLLNDSEAGDRKVEDGIEIF